MEIEKSKVLIQFLLIFRQSGVVLFFLHAHRFPGYTATNASILFYGSNNINWHSISTIVTLYNLYFSIDLITLRSVGLYLSTNIGAFESLTFILMHC